MSMGMYDSKPYISAHNPYVGDINLDIAWEVFVAACGQVQLDTAGWHLEKIGKMAYIHDFSETVPVAFPDALGGTPSVVTRTLTLMARALEIAYEQMVQIEHRDALVHEKKSEKNPGPVVE